MAVNSLAFSPDGKTRASGNGVDQKSGKLKRRAIAERYAREIAAMACSEE